MTSRKKGGGNSPARPRGIVWTRRALADLQAIDAYVADDNPAAAERWVHMLIDKAEAAARWPQSGRIVPEMARPDIREVLLRTYRIVYRLRSTGIEILTLFEGHRLFPSDLPVPDSVAR